MIFMPELKLYKYDAEAGVNYALKYANYYSLPENQRLFYYAENGSDCSNFISQCLWASYGGYLPGDDLSTIQKNISRIKTYVRQVTPVWFGSTAFPGSTNWCNVEALYNYLVSQKSEGPKGKMIAEGLFTDVQPTIFKNGDVIQLIVKGYNYGRFGHSLYVTQEGSNYYDVRICCHSYDRRNTPLMEFAEQPEVYPKMRLLRMSDSYFKK